MMGDVGARARWLFVVVFLGGCGEPLIMIPGGQLAGQVVPPPAEWDAVGDTVQLEFRPETSPYSINIWAVVSGRDVYVMTGEGGTRWTGYLQDDPLVRLRLDGLLYELTAVEVSDPNEHRRVFERYVTKYGVDADGDWSTEGRAFRLARR